MAAILGGDGGGGGGLGEMGQFPLEQWFFEMPPCTRYWTTATVLTAVLTQCKIVNPLQLYYSFRAVYVRSQYWRLVTTFTYFGPLSLDLLFHLFFLQRYSRLLESSSGASPATFSWLLLYACTSLLLLSSTLFSTGSLLFLGSSLSSTIVYIWSRRNPDTRLSLMGLLVFTAPYLPWVLMAFSLVMHGSVPRDEILGVVVGHVWYFFADVWPGLYEGQRPMDPPAWWVRLWEGRLRVEEGSEPRGVDGDVAAAAAAAAAAAVRPQAGEVR
ncbi:hypothetical protein GJ744_010965 [Endocarpon pusillum]|uniref:Derlin n=1 Tax=Endocarpon pusillum TaxID=364733 RepID=A0A8H7AHD2_9EURO|nr:hypothetical protein GJ744_010965 [Endocarpon pusillum]